MKAYTVSVDDHEQQEAAGATMWDTAYSTLHAAQAAIYQDAGDYRRSQVKEGMLEEGGTLPDFVKSDFRAGAWELADDAAGRSWYIQEVTL